MFATSAFILLLSAAALTVAAPVTSTFSVTATALADTPTLSGTASDDASLLSGAQALNSTPLEDVDSALNVTAIPDGDQATLLVELSDAYSQVLKDLTEIFSGIDPAALNSTVASDSPVDAISSANATSSTAPVGLDDNETSLLDDTAENGASTEVRAPADARKRQESLLTPGNVLKGISIATTLAELLGKEIPESAKASVKNELTKVENKFKSIFKRQSLELVEELLEGTELGLKFGPEAFEAIKNEIEKHFGKKTTTSASAALVSTAKATGTKRQLGLILTGASVAIPLVEDLIPQKAKDTLKNDLNKFKAKLEKFLRRDVALD